MDLSLILCSRNDAYMGNSRWRLETTLNGIAERLVRLGRADVVEIVVADWGSEVPLGEVLALEPAAHAIVSFVTIPPAVARRHQGDSPFPEVIALNAAARRARGRYIGRIDQDTIVGERFFRWFFAELGAGGRAGAAGEASLYFANRRGIPYRLASACPDRRHVDRVVRWFGSTLRVWRTNPSFGDTFWSSWVGIWLAHRARWEDAGGYDERMIYYNWMETDMIQRLLQRGCPIVDAGAPTGYDFYHLDHVDPRERDRPRDRPRRNPDLDRTAAPAALNPNGPDWGLAGEALTIGRAARPPVADRPRPELAAVRDIFSFGALMTRLTAALGADAVAIAIARWSTVTRRRLDAARRGVAAQPLRLWPATLWRLWLTRKVHRAR